MKTVARFAIIKIRPLYPEEGDSLLGRAILRNMSYTSVASDLEINLHRKNDDPNGMWVFKGVDGEIEVSLNQMFELRLAALLK